jgi:hypothetical protein
MLRAGKSDVRTPVEGRDFAPLQKSRPTLGSVPPPTEWNRRSYPRLKRPGREVCHSPSSTAEVNPYPANVENTVGS